MKKDHWPPRDARGRFVRRITRDRWLYVPMGLIALMALAGLLAYLVRP